VCAAELLLLLLLLLLLMLLLLLLLLLLLNVCSHLRSRCSLATDTGC
jgi:hypothetical protein